MDPTPTNLARLRACGLCRHRESSPWPMTCGLAGEPCDARIESGVCPAGRFAGLEPVVVSVLPRPPVERPRRWAIRLPGPGWTLARLIAAAGLRPAAGCGCQTMRQQMDAWGWLGSLRRLNEIAAHLRHEAGRAGHEIPRGHAFGLADALLRQLTLRWDSIPAPLDRRPNG